MTTLISRQPIIIIVIALKPMATIYKQIFSPWISKSPFEHIPWLDLGGWFVNLNYLGRHPNAYKKFIQIGPTF